MGPMTGRGRRWWAMVGLNGLLLLAGQTAATLLGRAYYDRGGHSIWMATLVQCAGFPLLLLFRLVIPSSAAPPRPRPPPLTLTAVYVFIGFLLAADNLMYSYGMLFLDVSTFSLLCATQLAFNAVLSRLLNSQRFTYLIVNAVFLLSAAAVLLGLRHGGPTPASEHFAPGFALTLGASAAYALILCLMQLAFERVLKRDDLNAVVDMQVYTAAVASIVSVVGLFIAGEWREIAKEAAVYRGGVAGYVGTLVGTAASWQASSVGTVGLVSLASALFSNVVGAVALPLVPIFAAIFFGDAMDGNKILSLVLAVWGSASYFYQHYLDDIDHKQTSIAVDIEVQPPSSL